MFSTIQAPVEDHPLLRGNLTAFDLDGASLETRAEAFLELFESEHWPALTAALLTQGDYSRRLGRNSFRLGSATARAPWIDVLAGTDRRSQAGVRSALGALLDRLAGSSNVADDLKEIRREWLTQREEDELFDWRYYLVRYDAMREGTSGIYASEESTMGYRLCMLRKRYLNSYYRDPYLHAVHRESGVGDAVEDSWFMGYPDRERWMPLSRSGVALRCVDAGFIVRPPPAAEHRAACEQLCSARGLVDGVLCVARRERGGRQLDTEDRVQAGAAFVRALVAAGL